MKRVGVDIGGTFTDVVVLDEESGELHVTKVASTPERVADAAIAGLRQAADSFEVDRRNVRFVAHGSTIGTNTVIERRGARTALITTRGFRDVLELGRVARPAEALYDVAHRKARSLVPRRLRMELAERVGADGEVLAEVDLGEVDRITDALTGAGVESVAVCPPVLLSLPFPRKAGAFPDQGAAPRSVRDAVEHPLSALRGIRAKQHLCRQRIHRSGIQPVLAGDGRPRDARVSRPVFISCNPTAVC